jgi:hypothetical protein
VQALARDLSETAPHVPSRRPTARSSAPPVTWAVVWSREVLTGGVNPRRIDGMQEVSPMTGMHRLHQIDQAHRLLRILACRCDSWITRTRD